MTLREAMSEAMLLPGEEARLVSEWRASRDPGTLDRIVRSHMRLCFSVAARYDRNPDHMADLAQDGAFGLMAALESFDPARGTRFASWARWFVMAEIDKRRSRVALVVDMPPRVYRRARAAGADGDGPEGDAVVAARGELPLDASGESGAPIDALPSPGPDPEAEAAESERVRQIRSAVSGALAEGMKPREASVLRRRALADFPDTLDRIAADLGVSRERVRQIEADALRKLTACLAASGFPRSLLPR